MPPIGIDTSGKLGGFSNYVQIDPVALAELLRGPQGPVMRELQRVANLVKQGAQERVGVKTGNLKSRIVTRTVQNGSDFGMEIGAEVRYASWHHEGTPPHRIDGNPLLVFFWPKVGRVVAFPHVNHPGTKPNRFLTDALAAVRV